MSNSFHFGTELLIWPNFVFMFVSFCLSEESSVQLFETRSNKQDNQNLLYSVNLSDRYASSWMDSEEKEESVIKLCRVKVDMIRSPFFSTEG